jgi:hypothetical protein
MIPVLVVYKKKQKIVLFIQQSLPAYSFLSRLGSSKKRPPAREAARQG